MQEWQYDERVKSKDPKIIHQRNENGELEATIAIIDDEGKYFVGAASCSKEDQFDRKIGRDIATGRAKKAYAHHLNGNEKKREDLWTITDSRRRFEVVNAGSKQPVLR